MSSPDANSTIVVGVAEEGASGAAVRWAVDEAAVRGAQVHLVHAVPHEVPYAVPQVLGVHAPAAPLPADPPGHPREPDVALRRAAEQVRAASPGQPVRSSAVRGTAREVLLRVAADAAAVVTGPGRTAVFLAEHAPCPVVVVGEDAPAGARGVVVGFDVSPAATAALEVAAAEAALRGEPLRVVHTTHLPGGHLAVTDPEAHRAARRRARARVRAAVERAAEVVRRRHDVEVEVVVVTDSFASDVLVERSRRARLLVVGAHERTTFAVTLRGSTERSVLHRAHVPVVVVPVPPRVVDVRRAPAAELAGTA
ncbi:universal stress protein [Paenibacillus sp. TRM 82003]|uniref:universal stress protein n=1 Tax=Kineococcus sp. TRM81007 TaxID=2925831 RepID=UPI001F5A2278|nr:universal stress protein [Kineococcus sp. TRM81007]MCI2237267.1 universal stress protein [Kineococcus sp. TRM81007]MCI3919326.1 universal stress protein [Paenibacillus sp. TRM 82003]